MPPRRTSPKGYERAHENRREPTPAEAKLWEFLRGGRLRGVAFRRQHAIDRYVVDFCAPRHRLIIEVDGRPHVGNAEQDATRAKVLEQRGYRVVRFWNSQVLDDIDAVTRTILNALNLQ